jgi:DNA-3-methyladenine glycosylase II
MSVTRLFPKPPYNFHLSAMIFSGGDPQIRTYEQGIFRQVLVIGGTAMLAEVFSRGTTNEPELYLSLYPENALAGNGNREAGNLVSSMFNIHEDLSLFYEAMREDAVMTSLISQLRGVKSPTTPTVFEALVDSVIEQQISLKAAHSIENRLIRAFGPTLTCNDLVYYGYPTPQTLAETMDSGFRACGLTRRKGECIREISQRILSGAWDPENFRAYPETERVINELTKIRGIGRWTAELTILRGLHRPDAFPADDIGVRRFIGQYYMNDKKISPVEARSFAERWGRWKGYAAYYLEIADLLGITPSCPDSGGVQHSPCPGINP